MSKLTPLFILLAVILAACGTQTPSPPAPPTAAPAEPTQTEPTLPPEPTEGESAELPMTFKLIPGESELQYEVGEVFINQDNRFNVAIGVTKQIEGEIIVDPTSPSSSRLGTFTADVSQFKSDSNRRDSTLRNRFLESATYPTVTFIPSQIEGIPDNYQEGEQVQLKITGDLTIREVTNPVTFDTSVKYDGEALRGEATTTILMSEFGFGPISIAGILNTEDEAKVTLFFVAKP
jgi:polyisoprenoid-binding protein YceI